MLKSIFKAVAVSAVAAFFSIGCGGGGGNPADPNNPNNGGGGGAGKLTITGLPSGTTYDVYVLAAGIDFSDPDALDEEDFVATTLSNSGNVFTLIDPRASAQANSAVYFTGSGNRDVILSGIKGSPSRPTGVIGWHATVNFSNGSATVPFSKFTLLAEEDFGDGGNPADTANPNTGGGGDDSYTYSGGTVEIGGKTWMAKNLDRATTNSKCYNNSADSCAKYGRLYNWNDAKSACPSGWRLPSDADWTALTDAVGGSSTAGKKLKSTAGWDSHYGDNGTDDYGFAALPGGYGYLDGNFNYAFNYAGYNGYWWSSTELADYVAWGRNMRDDLENVERINASKSNLFSVRCVQA